LNVCITFINIKLTIANDYHDIAVRETIF
jgi:hypothetical protein